MLPQPLSIASPSAWGQSHLRSEPFGQPYWKKAGQLLEPLVLPDCLSSPAAPLPRLGAGPTGLLDWTNPYPKLAPIPRPQISYVTLDKLFPLSETPDHFCVLGLRVSALLCCGQQVIGSQGR